MNDNEQPQSVPTPEPEPAPKAPDAPPAPVAADPEAAPAQDAAPPAEAAPKPAAKPAPKTVAPKPPAVMQAEAWEGEIPSFVKEKFGDGVMRAATYREQDFFEAGPATVVPLLYLLRDEFDYDYLVEETAVDYPKDEKRFEIVYVLYSFSRNHRIRIKTRVAENEEMPTAVPVYTTANWLEREIYDMFGVRFSGHPDLRRILMPDEWQGYPLRKDYGIIQQDQRWVQENLGIESGQ
ncbi:MAG: NADH-quinone oxidoreductase subunit C [Bryobacterales bacterium]|nr:NADH-quinone oxidoreductase subunit C [Bryobacterales bacterium]